MLRCLVLRYHIFQEINSLSIQKWPQARLVPNIWMRQISTSRATSLVARLVARLEHPHTLHEQARGAAWLGLRRVCLHTLHEPSRKPGQIFGWEKSARAEPRAWWLGLNTPHTTRTGSGRGSARLAARVVYGGLYISTNVWVYIVRE